MIHSLTRSQWRLSWSSGVIWSRQFPPNITRAAQFNTRWSLSINNTSIACIVEISDAQHCYLLIVSCCSPSMCCMSLLSSGVLLVMLKVLMTMMLVRVTSHSRYFVIWYSLHHLGKSTTLFGLSSGNVILHCRSWYCDTMLYVYITFWTLITSLFCWFVIYFIYILRTWRRWRAAFFYRFLESIL